MVTGPGTSAYGTGEIWHLLDTRVDMPITMVDSHNLRRIDLDNYTHVIMTTPLRVAGATEQLDSFVKGGGVLWLQGAATVAWAANEKLTEAIWRMTLRSNKRLICRVPRKRMLALTLKVVYYPSANRFQQLLMSTPSRSCAVLSCRVISIFLTLGLRLYL